jgi:hypothetical protein
LEQRVRLGRIQSRNQVLQQLFWPHRLLSP